MKGWIKDYRQELGSDIWMMPPMYHRIWQWIKYNVNHEEGYVPLRDGGRQKILKGQHMTSIRQIAQGVGWYEGRKWKEPNPKTVRSILKWLEQQGMITITTFRGNNGYTLINVVNWEVYQSKDEQGNIEYPFEKQSTDINKNDKNEKNKNNPPKRKKRVYEADSTYMKMAQYMLKKIIEWKPDYEVKNMQKWADDCRKILDLDKRDKKRIIEIIDWATSHSFWQSNILSPEKLRKQFHTLDAQMSNTNNPKVVQFQPSAWEERKRQEEEVERKRLEQRDRQIKVQQFIDAGFHPMNDADLLEEWLEGRISLADLKERKWGS